MKIELDESYFQNIFDDANKLYIGVNKKSNLLASDYSVNPKIIGGGVTVNPKKLGSFYEDEFHRKKSVAESWLSVWQKTPIQSFYVKNLQDKVQILVEAWLMGADVSEQDLKRAMNSLRAIYMQAYVSMSRYYTVTDRRAAIKKFGDYAIGTGETMEATKAWIIKSDSSK